MTDGYSKYEALKHLVAVATENQWEFAAAPQATRCLGCEVEFATPAAWANHRCSWERWREHPRYRRPR
jgi:hypothetical protein